MYLVVTIDLLEAAMSTVIGNTTQISNELLSEWFL